MKKFALLLALVMAFCACSAFAADAVKEEFAEDVAPVVEEAEAVEVAEEAEVAEVIEVAEEPAEDVDEVVIKTSADEDDKYAVKRYFAILDEAAAHEAIVQALQHETFSPVGCDAIDAEDEALKNISRKGDIVAAYNFDFCVFDLHLNAAEEYLGNFDKDADFDDIKDCGCYNVLIDKTEELAEVNAAYARLSNGRIVRVPMFAFENIILVQMPRSYVDFENDETTAAVALVKSEDTAAIGSTLSTLDVCGKWFGDAVITY